MKNEERGLGCHRSRKRRVRKKGTKSIIRYLKRRKLTSVPIDIHATRATCETYASFRFSFQPLHSPLVIFKMRSKPFITALVVFLKPSISSSNQKLQNIPKTNLQPRLFLLGEHGLFNHPCLDRYTGESFKSKPNISVKLPLCLQKNKNHAHQ